MIVGGHLTIRGDGIGSEQGVDTAFRDNMGLQTERVRFQRDVQRNIAASPQLSAIPTKS
jgi:hypothetical protein